MLRMSGAKPLLLLYAFMVCKGTSPLQFSVFATPVKIQNNQFCQNSSAFTVYSMSKLLFRHSTIPCTNDQQSPACIMHITLLTECTLLNFLVWVMMCASTPTSALVGTFIDTCVSLPGITPYRETSPSSRHCKKLNTCLFVLICMLHRHPPNTKL